MIEKCPVCKKGELDYEGEDWGTKGQLSVEVGCTESSCEWVGYMVYKIHFSHAEDLIGNRVA